MSTDTDGVAYHLLVRSEREIGARVLRTGERPWLVKSDWVGEPVVSVKDNDVRIVAIIARSQGRGTFKRLVKNIQADGLNPVVVAPFFQMEAILTKWGWTRGKVEEGHDEWRPTAVSGPAARPAAAASAQSGDRSPDRPAPGTS